MSYRVLDVFGLRETANDPATEIIRPMVARLLDLTGSLGPAGGRKGQVEDPGEVLAELHRRFGEATGLEEIASIADAALTLCQATVTRQGRERTDAGAELAAVIVLVREAMASLAGDEKSYSERVTVSATRLEAIGGLSDISEIKNRLVDEVQALKSLATDREARWRSKAAAFEERIEGLEKQLAETSVQATYDTLTGVENRRGIEQRFRKPHPASRQMVLAMVDLDGFKLVNDTFGHGVGDEVLIATARGLRDAVRSDDVVGRLGGDEFVLLMENLTLRQAEHRLRAVVESVCTAISTAAAGAPGAKPQVSASCGVAEFSAGDSFASVLRRADQALYEAKRMGKGRVVARSAPFIRDLRKG